jgi:hypothetical protein
MQSSKTPPSILCTACVAVAPPLLAIAVGVALWALVPPRPLAALLKEGGVVETLTEVLFVLVAAAVWYLWPAMRGGWRSRLALSVCFVAFAAREMDLHIAFTGTSVLKVSFYLRDAPWHQKVVALGVVSTVALAMIHLARTYARPYRQAVRDRVPVAVTVTVFGVAMAVAKVLDRSVNVLAGDFGVEVTAATAALVSSLEETLEVSLPILAGLALLQARTQEREQGMPVRRLRGRR